MPDLSKSPATEICCRVNHLHKQPFCSSQPRSLINTKAFTKLSNFYSFAVLCIPVFFIWNAFFVSFYPLKTHPARISHPLKSLFWWSQSKTLCLATNCHIKWENLSVSKLGGRGGSQALGDRENSQARCLVGEASPSLFILYHPAEGPLA